MLHARRSECLAWDAEEYEVDEQNDLFMSEFLDVADGVTGTRKTDVANAPSGYAYSLVGVSQPPTIYVNKSNRSARPFGDNHDEYVVAEIIFAATAEQAPLAPYRCNVSSPRAHDAVRALDLLVDLRRLRGRLELEHERLPPLPVRLHVPVDCHDELGPVSIDDQVACSILDGNQPGDSTKLEYE